MNCYNGERYLREAIGSVLAQTFTNWELVFWDNKSTDSSAELFHSFKDSRLRYFLAPQHTHLGKARAQAWPHLNGEFMGVIDTDDIWLPSKLETQLDCFHDADIGLCITNANWIKNGQKKIAFNQPPPEGWVTGPLLKYYYPLLSTILFRRSSIKCLSYGFDPDFRSLSDFDLVLRLSTVAKLVYAPAVLTELRLHKESETVKYGELFWLEKRLWVTKNQGSPGFLTYQEEIESLRKKIGQNAGIYFLSISQNAKVREEMMSLGLGSLKHLILFLVSYLPLSKYLLVFWRYIRLRTGFRRR